MKTVRLPKGTIIQLNGLPCELAEDVEVFNTTIAEMGLEEFLRWSRDSQSEVAISDLSQAWS